MAVETRKQWLQIIEKLEGKVQTDGATRLVGCSLDPGTCGYAAPWFLHLRTDCGGVFLRSSDGCSTVPCPRRTNWFDQLRPGVSELLTETGR